MRKFFGTDGFSDLESELRDGRPEPRSEFVQQLVSRTESVPTRTPVRRPRVAAALVFAVVVVVALSAFGGVGYAKSSIFSAAKSSGDIVSSVVRKGDDKPNAAVVSESRSGTQGSGSQSQGSNNDARSSGVKGGSGSGHEDPPWMHQYSRYVVICVPYTVRIGHKVYRGRITIVVPRQSVDDYVPPGTLGPCRFFPR